MLLTRRYGSMGALRNLFAGLGLAFVAALPLRAEPVTIAALGDSLTQGYGLIEQDGFVPQLSRWLVGHGHEVRVINAGVSGDTSAGGLSRIDWTLTPDVDALMIELGANDMLRGVDPAVTRANLEAIIQKAQEHRLPILLIGIAAPANYGPDYQREFDAIYPELAAQYDTLHYVHFMSAIADQAAKEGAITDYLQPDGLHPTAEGVALIVNDIGPYVEQLIEITGN
ncbi:arylesterase [Actibacterium sp. XHP0104]|uniref:arylesterase n=1 Tax=Actibacterium sp. XHP0104 TaxID=2984335 RepID=UPI0021E7D2F8|nr:arylesterase [Actibacterium sp. XHP0104]MCV2882799.1 arylesterase [Actibacterium sp. XHP0104]